ncbi:MAG: hypothetical protein WAM14_10830 [Candidatus Nitrosopolaris sp.]
MRKDLIPRVYFYAAFRLLLSSVVAAVIYFLYMLANPSTGGISNVQNVNPSILLLCFLAGVAPIQFLINFADSRMSRIFDGWKRRDIAGNRHITQISGIDSITAERLAEEGITSIQQMALINPTEMAEKTKFPEPFVIDWNDQAILYLLSGDRVMTEDPDADGKKAKTLYDLLGKKLGIYTISSLLEIWDDNESIDGEEKHLSFFKCLDLIKDEEYHDLTQLQYLFAHVIGKGRALYNQFRRPSKPILKPT